MRVIPGRWWWLFGKISVASGLMRLVSGFSAAALLVSVVACIPAAGGHRNSVRVLVYNIHAGTDAARIDNLDRVAEIIRRSRADVVLLQEVDKRTRRSGGVDQLERLRVLLGYKAVFGKAIDYDGGEYGIGILSRWNITSSRFSILPVELSDSAERRNYEERGALVARIAAPAGTIRVVNTHLDATRGDSNRVRQARTLLGIVNVERDSGFTVIGGDLNSEPAGPVVHMLEDAGWIDFFPRCATGERFTFPAAKPVKRIDFLFGAKDSRCVTSSVLNTQASDHRPVLFEIVARRD
jgi:endonuclease/exonuclease/phosphatase family metal-dependent hydrolase